MATSDHSDSPTGDPNGVTYDRATPEQVAHVRKDMQARLAAADARWTPEEREQRRAAFLARLDTA
jgi:hypothetical protein